MKKWLYCGLIILLVAIGGLIYVKFTSQAQAAGAGDIDGIDLHILLEASIDNGATWHNYSGTDVSGGETLVINPGATVLYRLKVWNNGAIVVANVAVTGEVDNTGHMTDVAVTNNQLGANPFAGFDIETGGHGLVGAVPVGGSQNAGYEGLQGYITFANNFPGGETIINGVAVINDYGLIGRRNNQLFRLAHAEGVNHFSTVRLVVNPTSTNPGTPKTAPSPTPTSVINSLSTLPLTGGSLVQDLKEIYLKF